MAYINGAFDFTNEYRPCFSCDATGISKQYTTPCTVCNGKGKVPKGKRSYKCMACLAQGYTRLEKPIDIGTCPNCNGLGKVPRNLYASISQLEAIELFKLFNFDAEPLDTGSTFNENYLGLGSVAGVVDYGRYKKLPEDEFREMVRESFYTRFEQCIHFVKKGYVLKAIQVKRTNDGWHAYTQWSPEPK